MAWNEITWACGHEGRMQLYGKSSARKSRLALEAGRQCMVCWLIDRWEAEGDPRASREDRENLAAGIAANKGKEINLEEAD